MTDSSVSLFSGLALQQVLDTAVLEAFQRDGKHQVATTYEPTRVLVDKIAAGDRPDLMIGVASALDELAQAADPVLSAASVRPLVRSGLGLAVPPAATMPDIGTRAAFVHALRETGIVAYSATGASGVYFASLLADLGIAEEVNRTACVVSKGFVAETLLDGRADIAVQQVVELATVPGIQIVGPFPPEVQHYVELSMALAPAPTPAARDLYEFLQSDTALAAYRSVGLEPAGDDSDD